MILYDDLLDARFRVKVERINESLGLLSIIDNGYDKILHEQEVALSYGAQFGPDVEDVAAWQAIAINKVDSL